MTKVIELASEEVAKVIEVASARTKELIYHCTSSTRPSAPAEGQHIYETDTDKTLKNVGTTESPNWKELIGEDEFDAHLAETMTEIFNVKTGYNATGDGVTDDTAAIQAAVDAADAAGGGTVYVPAGTYMINVGNSVGYGIHLKSNIDFVMDKNAELKAITNSLDTYWILYVGPGVDNVKIVVGTLTGDRDTHTGNTGEWGWGIFIQGASNIIIENGYIANFWGDGIDITADSSNNNSNNITINNVRCHNNRRNGMTLGGVSNLLVMHSKFNNSNGTTPEAGVDLEPDSGDTNENIVFFKCHFEDNSQSAVLNVLNRSSNISFYDCVFNAPTGSKGRSLTWSGTGEDKFVNCKFTGPLVDIEGASFTDCKFTSNASYTVQSRVFSCITDEKVSFDSCNFYATGIQLIRATSSSTDGTRKIFRNCKFNIIGNTLADMSEIAVFTHHFTLENCDFIHSGSSPATGYALDLNKGRNARIVDTSVDDTFNYSYGTEGRYNVNQTKLGITNELPTDNTEQYKTGEVIFKETHGQGNSMGWVCIEGGRAHKQSVGYLTSGNVRITGVTNIDTWAVGQTIKAEGIPNGTTCSYVSQAGNYIDLSQAPTVSRYESLYDAVFAPIGYETHGEGTYDFDADAGTQGRYVLGRIPNNATITKAWYEVLTAPNSAGSATVSLGVRVDDETGLLAATAYNDASFSLGYHDALPDGSASNFTTKTTGMRDVILRIQTADLTAGKIKVYWEFVVSE